jgi:hypothetical protein
MGPLSAYQKSISVLILQNNKKISLASDGNEIFCF